VLELPRQRIVQEALEHLDAVASGTTHRVLVELGRKDLRRRHGRGQHGRDRADARAEIRGHSRRREERRRSSRQWLGLPSRHVDARCDEQSDAAEGDRPGQPCDRLTVGPTRDQVVEHVRVTGSSLDELVGFLARRDAARLCEHPRHRDTIQPHGISLSESLIVTCAGRD
jgi:hypothetical protein